jgi:hypothetical protein
LNKKRSEPAVLNIRDCASRQVPDGAVYIGRTVSRARLPGSKWGNPFKATKQGTRRRTRSPLRCIGGGWAVSRSCWPRCPSSAAAIWSVGARRCHATVMCCWNSPTNDSAALPGRPPPHTRNQRRTAANYSGPSQLNI